jgi:hypothetical protein
MDATSTSLAMLPTMLLGKVVSWLPSMPPSLFDVAHLDGTSRLFRVSAPRSAVEEGLRLRAEAAGRSVETALPACEMSWAQWLLCEVHRCYCTCEATCAGTGAGEAAPTARKLEPRRA